LLGLFCAAVAINNFQVDTRLLSWDLMDSSFNPVLNVWRSLTGTWQSFQGLGLLGGHGYVAQLPHALFLSLLSLWISQDLLRYCFAFLMMVSGVYGAFFPEPIPA
jgi:hypothetical protein